MIWFCVILIGALTTVADIFLFAENKNAKTCIHAFIRDTLTVNLSAFFIMKNLLGMNNLFTGNTHGPHYESKYTLLAVAAGIVFLCLIGFVNKRLQFKRVAPKHRKGAMALKIVSAVFAALGCAAYTGTLWGKEAFGDLTPDQILINLNSPTEGTDTGVYVSLFEGPVLTTALLTTLFCIIIFSNLSLIYKNSEKVRTVISALAVRTICFVLAVAVFVGGFAFCIERFQLMSLYDAYMSASSYIEDNYADPEKVELTFPEKKRNLIFIYLESMENTFFSKELGGYFEENLMPDLAELMKEGISFSHTDKGFGGIMKTVGSTWSVAGMVNMFTGLPMKVPVSGNSYGQPDNFLPGATALGDILKEQGYEQSIMFGADSAFGGLNFFYESHGDYNILDWPAVKKLGWLPKNYKQFWGYEDDKLYEFAKREITRLYETGKPFNFVMETADTHAPEGYLSKHVEDKFWTRYANVVHYSQGEAVKFIRWIQKQPFYKNTTIVVVGDHLSMANAFFEDVTNYERTIFNLILNPAKNVADIPKTLKFNRKWAPFDMFPTTLASLGVEIEGNRLGIGTNMFSGDQTLIERDGYETVQAELGNRSNFYNNNILVDWSTVR